MLRHSTSVLTIVAFAPRTASSSASRSGPYRSTGSSWKPIHIRSSADAEPVARASTAATSTSARARAGTKWNLLGEGAERAEATDRRRKSLLAAEAVPVAVEPVRIRPGDANGVDAECAHVGAVEVADDRQAGGVARVTVPARRRRR